jgi:hypothetical protein
MAGTLKVDSINADSNLALKIANTAVAYIDSNGLRPTSGNVSLDSTGTTGVRSPAANTLVGYTGGVERLRVTSAGDIGVGNSSPEEKFHILGTGSLYAKVESTGTQAGIKFETTTAGTAEYGILADSSEALRFYDFKNGSEPVRFNRYGIGLGGTTPSSGMGITFPATSSDSSNANTLDDYEEGTWTPQLGSDSTQPTVTYSVQNGTYQKIGNQVYVEYYLSWTSFAGGSGGAVVKNLPFTAGYGVTDQRAFFYVFGYSGPTLTGTMASVINAAGTYTILYYNNNASIGSIALSSMGTSGGSIRGNFWYKVTN